MKKSLAFIGLLINLTAFAQLENLGPLVNSNYEEISPYITPDGSKLFFIRENHPQNTNFGETQDVWWSAMESDAPVTAAKHLGAPFNTLTKNAVTFQSPDGQTRIIKGVLDKFGNYKKSGYSVCTLGENGWSDPQPLNIRGYDNMTKGKYVGMCMAPGGNTMILSFSEKRDSPDSELYISHWTGGNDWSKPEKLPFTVVGDFAPFIASDNKTLYFSSDGRSGFGSADIFLVRRLDDTWNSWSEPENMGAEVNSGAWDAYFKVSPSGKYAFIVSNKAGSSDLYRLPLFRQEIKPDPVIIVEGIVKDAETGKPLAARLEYFNLADNSIQGAGRSSVSDGTYKVVLPYGSDFSVNATLQGYYAETIHLDLVGTGEFATVKKDLLLRPIKVESVIRLNNIFFETNKAELLPTSRTELDGLIAILNANPTMKIEIRGHTDNVGSDEFNRTLSDNRARSVVAYLVEKGIAAERLAASGYGETLPVAANDTDEGRGLNRRVEFKIQAL
jgi:outer membrane protein OmpA-like peptidoglycan-associated protein